MDSFKLRYDSPHLCLLFIIESLRLQKSIHPLLHLIVPCMNLPVHIVVCKVPCTCQTHQHVGEYILIATQSVGKLIFICEFKGIHFLLHKEAIASIHAGNEFF